MAGDLDPPVESWGEYELWEKTEVRLRKNRRRWIYLTVLLFILLSAVPVVLENKPKWEASRAAWSIAELLARLKTRSAEIGQAVRVDLVSDASKNLFEIRYGTKGLGCESASEVWVKDTGDCAACQEIQDFIQKHALSLLPTELAQSQKLERLSHQYCFDPLRAAPSGALGLVPLVDIERQSIDRLAILSWDAGSSRFQVTID